MLFRYNCLQIFHRGLVFFLVFLLPWSVSAATTASPSSDMTDTWVGYSCILIFAVAYILVMCEETLHLRKSKIGMLI